MKIAFGNGGLILFLFFCLFGNEVETVDSNRFKGI